MRSSLFLPSLILPVVLFFLPTYEAPEAKAITSSFAKTINPDSLTATVNASRICSLGADSLRGNSLLEVADAPLLAKFHEHVKVRSCSSESLKPLDGALCALR